MKRIFLIVMLCLSSLTCFKTYPIKEDISKLKELSIDNIYECCKINEIKYPEIVIAQSILETGNFTSKHCVENNNLFGLYDSKNKRYYKFNHWTESIIAYKNKIQYKYKDEEDYYDFLIRIKYAEDKEYINKLKSIK